MEGKAVVARRIDGRKAGNSTLFSLVFICNPDFLPFFVALSRRGVREPETAETEPAAEDPAASCLFASVLITSHELAACDKTYRLTVMYALRGKASCVSVS